MHRKKALIPQARTASALGERAQDGGLSTAQSPGDPRDLVLTGEPAFLQCTCPLGRQQPLQGGLAQSGRGPLGGKRVLMVFLQHSEKLTKHSALTDGGFV